MSYSKRNVIMTSSDVRLIFLLFQIFYMSVINFAKFRCFPTKDKKLSADGGDIFWIIKAAHDG